MRTDARARFAVVVIVLAVIVAGVVVTHSRAGASETPVLHSSESGTTTTTTTTTSIPTTVHTSGGPIIAGPSRSECLTLNTAPGQSGLAYVQSLVSSFDSLTDSSVTCISAYVIGTATWSQWIHPWVINSEPGYSSWVAQDPKIRQLVIAMNLIPTGIANVNNPLPWEKACAAGRYDSYARQFARNLVSAGIGNSVIRLGPELNGVWENDFIGTKKVEQKMWARCFANEVTSMRHISGEHLLFDWNVNACTGNFPFANYYPGNAYVDIMGIDIYDVGCDTPTTPLTFPELANETLGLTHFESFAEAKGKPMSLPEWGLVSTPSGDDPAYVDGIGATVASGDFAFETYFDQAGPIPGTLPLGPSTPLSVVAFQNWFGTTSLGGVTN